MNKKIYILIVSLSCGQLFAQTPDDALRLSWITPSGTARNQAIGGAMGSLGGEITSIFVNPAGIAFYKNSEFVFTPGYQWTKTKGSFRQSDYMTLDNTSKFSFGTTGFVGGWADKYSKWKSKAIGIAVNRTANFNQDIYYSGANDYSSFSEQYAEEFANSGLPINVQLDNAPLSLGTKLANYTYLIDTVTVNGKTEVVGLPTRDAILGNYSVLLNQEKHIQTTGGITEVSLAFAANMDDKIYIGGSIGVPIVNYESNSTIMEKDASGITNNNFNFANYNEKYTASGVGVNAKLGVIFRPAEFWRFGAAISTPTLYGLDEKTTGSMKVDLENYFPPGQNIRTADDQTIYGSNGVPTFKNDLVTPWKFLLSGSYVLREVQDITKQKGFITADVEYTNYQWAKFSSADGSNSDDTYYNGVNSDIKAAYKGAFNFKVGGELKFKIIAARLGFSYYGSPYEDKSLKGQHMYVSGGLGYRNKGIFIDLSYSQQINKDVNFPYRLGDKANTYALLKEAGGSLLLTFGIKI
jgi:hypothetical protein